MRRWRGYASGRVAVTAAGITAAVIKPRRLAFAFFLAGLLVARRNSRRIAAQAHRRRIADTHHDSDPEPLAVTDCAADAISDARGYAAVLPRYR